MLPRVAQEGCPPFSSLMSAWAEKLLNSWINKGLRFQEEGAQTRMENEELTEGNSNSIVHGKKDQGPDRTRPRNLCAPQEKNNVIFHLNWRKGGMEKWEDQSRGCLTRKNSEKNGRNMSRGSGEGLRMRPPAGKSPSNFKGVWKPEKKWTEAVWRQWCSRTKFSEHGENLEMKTPLCRTRDTGQ